MTVEAVQNLMPRVVREVLSFDIGDVELYETTGLDHVVGMAAVERIGKRAVYLYEDSNREGDRISSHVNVSSKTDG